MGPQGKRCQPSPGVQKAQAFLLVLLGAELLL